MSTALFISPHFDDAVFSCAGMIRHLIQSGMQVMVATVFTEGGAEHALRQQEDHEAAALLGFTPLHLGFSDAPFRTPGYQGFKDILFGWQAQDARMEKAVAERLSSLREETAPARIFAPLGIGTHVDHRIVYQAVASAEWSAQVEFYEDRPYAYARGAAELRLGQLRFRTPAFDKKQLLKDWRILPFVRQYLPPGRETRECENLLLTSSTSAAIHSAKSITITCDATLCRQAAKCYASQYAAFCGGESAHAMLDMRLSTHLGSPAARSERFWSLHSSIS